MPCAKWYGLSLFLFFCLAACQPSSPPVDAAVIKPLLRVQHTPALRWLSAPSNRCARQQGLGLWIDERSTSQLNFNSADIILRLGAPENLTRQAFTPGTDDLLIIVHQQNPVQQMDLPDLRAVFSGQKLDWSDLPGAESGSAQIQVWTYPAGEDATLLLQDSLAIAQVTSLANLAPDPKAMLQAVAANPNAIGYLPRRWLDQTVKAVNTPVFSAPILALIDQPENEAAKTWLACLQSAIADLK